MTTTDMIAAHQRWLDAQAQKRRQKRVGRGWYQYHQRTAAQEKAAARRLQRERDHDYARMKASAQNSAMLGGAMIQLLGGGR